MRPPHNGDQSLIAEWILRTEFPLDEDEIELLERVKETLYTGEPNNVERLYSLRILYWQVVGWCRGRDNDGGS